MQTSRAKARTRPRQRVVRSHYFTDFLRFRRMLTPVLLEILFWLGVATCVAWGSGILARVFVRGGSPESVADTTDVVKGLALVVVGPVVVRIICESWILFFRMNETLTDQLREQQKQNRRPV